MTGWVALLRAVNVGGTTKLPMDRLKAFGEKAGFAHVRTYIASGNLVFAGGDGEDAIRERLDALIEAEYGRRLGVVVRSAEEMAKVAARNPFAEHPANRVLALFADGPLSLDGLRHQGDEQLALGEREIFVHYPSGQGRSRLVIPAAREGTARNMNTVAKLAEMAKEAGE
jgi:uncharacterized protein (DUF1697 family)